MSEQIPEVSMEHTAGTGALPGLGSVLAAYRRAVDAVPDGEAGRARLLELYEQSGRSVAAAVTGAPDLPAIEGDLDAVALRARLVGWLDGLSRGMQVALMANQEQAAAALAHLRHAQRPEHVPFS